MAPGRRSAHGSGVHPRGIGLEEAAQRPEVQSPPVAPALTLVIARRPHAAAPAPALGRTSRSYMDDHRFGLLVEVHILDHRGPVDTEHATPYVGTEHRHPPRLLLGPSSSPKTRQGWRCSRQEQVRAPTDQSGEPYFSTMSVTSSSEATRSAFPSSSSVTNNDLPTSRCRSSVVGPPRAVPWLPPFQRAGRRGSRSQFQHRPHQR